MTNWKNDLLLEQEGALFTYLTYFYIHFPSLCIFPCLLQNPWLLSIVFSCRLKILLSELLFKTSKPTQAAPVGLKYLLVFTTNSAWTLIDKTESALEVLTFQAWNCFLNTENLTSAFPLNDLFLKYYDDDDCISELQQRLLFWALSSHSTPYQAYYIINLAQT